MPPKIDLDTPSEISVIVGKSLSISCNADGDPTPIVTWEYNGQIINDPSLRFVNIIILCHFV